MSQAEQLLRRMTGSITAYMDTVGHRPLCMSDYDQAVLAIRDGELPAFKELYPKLPGHADELLVETAGRPGEAGMKMMLLLLADAEQFPEEVYRTACRRAIGISDGKKVSFLLEQADLYVEKLPLSFYGDMAVYACLEHRNIAKEIIHKCTLEQIAAAPSQLLERFAAEPDFQTMSELVEKGISGGASAGLTLHMLTYEGRSSWIAENLLKQRMWVDPTDYEALHACIGNDAVEVAKLLLDGGMDFDGYRQWAQERQCYGHGETIQALSDYWTEIVSEYEQSGPQMGGPALG